MKTIDVILPGVTVVMILLGMWCGYNVKDRRLILVFAIVFWVAIVVTLNVLNL